jgi:hypothetical protein
MDELQDPMAALRSPSPRWHLASSRWVWGEGESGRRREKVKEMPREVKGWVNAGGAVRPAGGSGEEAPDLCPCVRGGEERQELLPGLGCTVYYALHHGPGTG